MNKNEIWKAINDQYRAYRGRLPSHFYLHPRTWKVILDRWGRGDTKHPRMLGPARVHVIHSRWVPVGALMEGPLPKG